MIETQRLRHDARLRRFFLGVLGVAVLAGAVGACAAIAGLSPYSVGECPGDGCDASVVHPGDGKVETDAGDGNDTEADGGGSICAEGACGTGCLNDSNNCGGCGSEFACAASQACTNGVCTPPLDGGSDTGGSCVDGGCPCTGGCTSVPTVFSCPAPTECNSTNNECPTVGSCVCFNDAQCKSNKCVKVTRENDVSCGNSNCTGTGSRDGFDCELLSPGIPSAGDGGSFSCPPMSGYKGTTLSCDPAHTNCYCTLDSQCPSNHCVSGSSNPNSAICSGCSGSGAADYRGCETVTLGSCAGICPANSTCVFPGGVCYCTSDVACASGHCIPGVNNPLCTNCSGSGADDGHGCQPSPSSVACVGTGGSSCTTSLLPPPVINAGKTACLCVDDADCSSKKCVNKDNQCNSGKCTGSGPADSEDCVTATSVPNAWSCVAGNCSNVSSPTGQCTAAGIPCWCTSDTQCPDGTRCAGWSGCAAGACTGAAAMDGGVAADAAADAGGDAGLTSGAFHCVP